MWRKRKTPSPSFRLPPPYNPITGEHANLNKPGLNTRLSVFQVVGDDGTVENQDTHDNYILCLGWDLDTDPDCRHLYDPTTNAQGKAIPVAKPYGVRGTYPYVLGQMVVVAKVRTRLGDNPGVASVTTGQPADLDEVIELLTDDDGNPISWLIVENGGEQKQFYNANSGTVPVDGVVAVTGVHGTEPNVLPQGDQPSSTYRKDYLVNGNSDVATIETGEYQDTGELVKCLYNSGTPAVGELWGPTEGQWYLSKGSTGNGDSNTTKTRADWGIIVTGIVDSTNKILSGRQVPYGMAKRCKCQLAGAVVATDSTRTVDNVVATSLGWAPVASTSDTITAHIQLNPSSSGGYAGADNTVAYIEFHDDDGYWWIYDMPCSA